MAEAMQSDSKYLASISSLGLDRLNLEPTRLRSEARDIEASVARLALQNYRVFIANHDCVRTLRSQSQTVKESTTSLRTQLSTFISKAQEFRSSAGDIMTAHHQNKHTLQQHMQILDILELPQLMDACLRNLLFEGALEIAAFANVLERRHSSRAASVVIMGVVSEIRTSMISLRSILLRQLQSPIQLPVCLNVISSLRRMDTLVLEKEANEKTSVEKSQHLALSLELKLQVDFLEARTVWLESELDSSRDRLIASHELREQRGDVSRWTLDLIEKNRTLWFDIATQFHAIFNEDSNAPTSFILSSWLLLRVESFIGLLHHCVPLIQQGAAMYEVLDQTMFFGASLGRLGIDFRALVAPIIEDAMLKLVLSRWNMAFNDLKQSLRHDGMYPVYMAELGGPTSVESTISISDSIELPEPPTSTLLFPALAHYVNMFLESFNELRQCAPCSLRPTLQEHFQQHQLQVAIALKSYVENFGIDGQSADVAASLWKEAGEVSLPYLGMSLAYLFTGKTASDMAKTLQQSLFDSFLSQGLLLPRQTVQDGPEDITNTPPLNGRPIEEVEENTQVRKDGLQNEATYRMDANSIGDEEEEDDDLDGL